MERLSVTRITTTRLPTDEGQFQLHLYRGSEDERDHLALVLGDIEHDRVLVRVHSECLTGEVFGSTRCDCREQLQRSIQLIAKQGAGVLVYLRQEGRGIGLADKLKAYTLQDRGYDTVDANLLLGHVADGRDYALAAYMLRDLGVQAVQLLTNNPDKLEGLRQHGFPECERVPLHAQVTPENAAYLEAKVTRMRHLLDLGRHRDVARAMPAGALDPSPVPPGNGRPSVTLTYAQSLDGSIAVRRGEPMLLSCPESLVVTHAMRARHDAILVGIGTVLSDNPQLTVRLTDGPDPIPIVLDSSLRISLDVTLLGPRRVHPWIATTEAASPARQRQLEAHGARVLRLPANPSGQVDLTALLVRLTAEGIGSVMVEGGARVITSFLAAHAVDRLVLTIAPVLVGGLNAIEHPTELNGDTFPSLRNPRYESLGGNLVLVGDVDHERR